jgi:hypothetical protein
MVFDHVGKERERERERESLYEIFSTKQTTF